MIHLTVLTVKLKNYLSKAFENRATCLLAVIIGIALWLRVWGIGYGLPYDLWMDGTHEVLRALKLGAGEYSWKFGKGGLYYLLFVEYGLIYVVWWAMGWVSNTHEFAVQVIQDPTPLFLAGRLTVALMGTLTCVVVYLIGKRVYDWRIGLGAAFIGATSYGHASFSHQINVDIGMVLAIWASILVYLEYEKREDRRWLIGAGILAGLAIAFKLPGALVLPALFLAIGSDLERWHYPQRMLRDTGIVLLATMVSLTVVAPGWTTSIGSLHKHFSWPIGESVASTRAYGSEIKDAIRSVTVYRGAEGIGYLQILLKDYNLALIITALLGAFFGLLRRQRWDIIWTVLVIVFLGIMSAAERSPAEHYVLPIMPALWLLSSYGIAEASRRHQWLNVFGLILVVSISVVTLVRQDYELTKPDTRILAKEWIEAHVPSGAKILMDGMRYRFTMSPPLTPNKSVLARQVAEAAQEGSGLSRGVSRRTLSLYAEAMEQVNGPTYELHSTVYGLEVRDPTYYVQSCFDYIITSSAITSKYASGINRERFPLSARFYEQLKTDSRFRVVYSVAPAPWKRAGPTITVYKVAHACGASQAHYILPRKSLYGSARGS